MKKVFLSICLLMLAVGSVSAQSSMTEEQIIMFHKLCDLQSKTAADEMRAAYKAGFKDGVALMREVQE